PAAPASSAIPVPAPAPAEIQPAPAQTAPAGQPDLATVAPSSAPPAVVRRVPSTPAAPDMPLAAIATSPPVAVARPVRFAIEFGPFLSSADAEQVERRLTESGYSTIRSRRPAGGTAYAVLIERVPTVH